MPPDRTEKKPIGPGRILDVLRAYARTAAKYPWLLLCAIVATTVIQGTAIIGPLYIRSLINAVATGTPSPTVVHAALMAISLYGAITFLGWLAMRIQVVSLQRVETGGMKDLMDEAFEYLIAHSYDYFTSNFAGTLTRRVVRYGRAFEQVMDSALLTFYPTLLFAIGAIVVLYFRNHTLALVLLLWVLFFIGLQIVLVRWRHELKVERSRLDSKVTGTISDAVSNHFAVVSFATERHEAGIVAAVVELWRKATLQDWNTGTLIDGIQGLLAIIIEVSLLLGAVYLWKQGAIQVGDFVLIQVYVLGLINQTWNIGNSMRRLYDSFSEAYEMLEIIEMQHEIEDAPDARVLKLANGAVSYKNVSFKFGNDKQVLADFSLEIKGGEKIALVGPSGAGKSTVTKLALRLYDVTDGSITVDGQDIREVTQESLRSAISLVPQEPTLFHRSLKENIAYGRLGATDEEIQEAAKKAHCHDFIMGLPFGYDTLVGERGVKLSGGERQRVAIARAILKNAPILILDEATSSLDSESEALIQDALTKLMEGKTVIAIAHRLSTIMKMDRIIVMEKGRTVLSGTHQELISGEHNLYKKLWEIQAGGFILDEETGEVPDDVGDEETDNEGEE